MSLKLEWDDASRKNLPALGPRLRPDEALNGVSEHERIGLPGRRVVVHDLLRRHAHPFDPLPSRSIHTYHSGSGYFPPSGTTIS